MALVLGTNCGFVAVAPVADPQGAFGNSIENFTRGARDTSPAGTNKITEIGWWKNAGSEDVNFEVGLYNETGGKPKNLISVSRTNSTGVDTGWKTVAVDWDIDPSTVYWLEVQVDNTTGATSIDETSSGGSGRSSLNNQTTLLNDLSGSSVDSDGFCAVYAVWEEAATGATRKVKISGSFVDKPIKTKVSGSFEDKPIKIKVGGSFQDA